MSAFPWLAFVIELPTFLVITWLFVRGRPARYAWPAAIGSILLAVAVTGWSFDVADRSHGMMWPQVLAALNGYVAFLAALLLAWGLPRLLERSGRNAGR